MRQPMKSTATCECCGFDPAHRVLLAHADKCVAYGKCRVCGMEAVLEKQPAPAPSIQVTDPCPTCGYNGTGHDIEETDWLWWHVCPTCDHPIVIDNRDTIVSRLSPYEQLLLGDPHLHQMQCHQPEPVRERHVLAFPPITWRERVQLWWTRERTWDPAAWWEQIRARMGKDQQ